MHALLLPVTHRAETIDGSLKAAAHEVAQTLVDAQVL
jgi:hypothetical protein